MDQQSPNNTNNDNPRTTNRGSRLERLWKSSHPWQAEHETEDDEVEVLEHGCASPLSPKRSTKRSSLGPAPSVRSPAAAFHQRWQERQAAVRGVAEQEQVTAVPSSLKSHDEDDEDVKMMIKMMEQQQHQKQQAQSTQPSKTKTKVKPKVKSTKSKKASSSRRQRIQQQPQQTPLPLAPPNNAIVVNDPEPASDMELLDIDFDADADALRQAIADEILAMWSAQGLYQDMPELRHEILNHVVEQKLTALQQDQQRLREQLILSGGYLNDAAGAGGLPSLSSSSSGISASNVAKRMSIIAEASDEDDDDSDHDSEWDDEDEEDQVDQQRLVATVTDDEQDNNNDNNNIPQQQQRRYSQEEEQIAYNAFNVLQELQERVECLDTHNHYCIEAMGCWGQLPPNDIPIRDHHAFDKYKLRDAVEQRVSQIFTDDHHVVSSFDQDDEAEADDDGKEEKNDSQQQQHQQQQSLLQSNQQDSSSSTVPVKQQLKEGLSKSFSAFDHLLQAKIAHDMADDEWTEYTVTEASAVTTISTNNKMALTAAKRISVDSAKTIRRSNSRESSVSAGEDYEEYTVDQASFMEYTVKSNGSTTVVDVDDLSEQREREKQQHRQQQQHQQQHLTHGNSPCSKANKATWAEETTPIKRNASSPVTMEGLLVSSRVLSDLQVPSTTMSPPRANSSNNNTKEQHEHQHALDLNNGSFPTITTTMFDDQDDDLTQITFDQTMEGATSTTQDHQHATTYLKRNMKKNHQQQQQHNNHNSSNRNKTHQSPPRKYHSAVDSQQTETTRDTTTVQGLRDDSENSNNHNDKASVSSSVDSHTAALLAKSVAKILRVDIWSLNAAVVLGALETLGHAASYGSTLRANIARLGGVIAVLRAMQVHPNHVPIQIAACVVLEELSVDRETQVAIGEVGGIPAIVAAMQGHLEDHQVQVAGCKVLANITNPQPAEDTPSEDNNGNDNDDDDDDIPADGAVAALVASMTRHATDPEIQAKAFAALANLCLDHPGRLQELSETGGLTAMTLALQRPWKNKMDQHEAISTLSILLRSLAELDTSSS